MKNHSDTPPKAGTRERKFLENETMLWIRRGLIREETRAAILDLYPEPEGKVSRLEGVAKATGALFLGLALLLLNAHNWEHYSPWLRLGIMATTLGGLHAAALLLIRHGRDTPGKAVAVLAAFAFGGGIALVGQAFNLDSGTPAPLAVWTLGVLPFALLLDSLPLHLIASALAIWWSCWFVTDRRPGSPAYMTGWLALLVAGVTLAAAYRRGRKALLHASLPVLAIALIAPILYGGLSVDEYDVDRLFPALLSAAAGLFIAASAAHEDDNAMRLPWRNWATWLGVVGLTLAGSSQFVDRTGRAIQIPRLLVLFTPGVILIGLLVVAIAGLLRSKGGVRPFGAAAVALASLATFTIPCGFTTAGMIAANLAQLGLGLWLLRDGARMGRLGGYALGVFILLVWGVARYVDFGREFGMLGTAGMMAAVGVSLFVAARFWKNIREERHEMREEPSPLPGVLEKPAAILHAARGTALVTIATLTVLTLLGMAVNASWPAWYGRKITMEVIPVDPNDLLRGEYVILDFDACHPEKIDGEATGARDREIPVNATLTTIRNSDFRFPDATVYAVLAPDASGIMKTVKWTHTRPANGVFLKGRIVRGWRMTARFGVEQFYVTQGRGPELEQARTKHRLLATLSVLESGEARVTGLTVKK